MRAVQHSNSAYLCPYVLAVLGVLIPLVPTSALSGEHQVIVAYYPIQPRWTLPDCPDIPWIGDLVRQFPLLGLELNNRTNVNVMRFDFQSMANAGVTVVNPHTFGTTVDYTRLNLINQAATDAEIMWTPTLEGLRMYPADLATATINIINYYGPSTKLMRIDGRPVFFWHCSDGATAQQVASAIDTVRAACGPVMIMLSENCTLGQPCQPGGGVMTINPLFAAADGSTGLKRVTGFYHWQCVYWAMASRSSRQSSASNFVKTCNSGGFRPVLGTCTSWNIESWGYQPDGQNCGIPGDMTNMPRYNQERSLTEWGYNLNDLLYNNADNAWIYIQAYDEWAEGTTLAPTTYGCFDWLAKLREVLREKGWLYGHSNYCRPSYPTGYAPTACADTPLCEPVPQAVIATYEAESDLSHQCGSAITGGWRATTANRYCYMANGPYVQTLPAKKLTGRFWLRVDNNTQDDYTIVRLDVYDSTGGIQLMAQSINRRTWTQANVYEPFDLVFNGPGNNHQLQFRAYTYGRARLDLDKVEILEDLPPNLPPVVDAGPNLEITLPSVAELNGTVVDDGLPNPPGTVTTLWVMQSGPGTVSFGNPSAVVTTASFSTKGTYVLHLVADDSEYMAYADVIVIVLRKPPNPDFDGDEDVDLQDFAYLQRCYSGSKIPPMPGCEDADLDDDNDVDQADFTIFKNCLGGADRPPGC